VAEEITSTYDEFGMRCERDAFDALLDHAPDKLQVVKKVKYGIQNKNKLKEHARFTNTSVNGCTMCTTIESFDVC